MKLCNLSSGSVITVLQNNYKDCPHGVATDVSEQRVYWFSPYMNKTLRSADYDGRNKVTHYVDTLLSTYPPSLARVGKMLFWGGNDFCMKFYDSLSGTTHSVSCVQKTVRVFAVYQRGKWINFSFRKLFIIIFKKIRVVTFCWKK